MRIFWSLFDQFCTYRFMVRSFWRLLFADLSDEPQAFLALFEVVWLLYISAVSFCKRANKPGPLAVSAYGLTGLLVISSLAMRGPLAREKVHRSDCCELPLNLPVNIVVLFFIDFLSSPMPGDDSPLETMADLPPMLLTLWLYWLRAAEMAVPEKAPYAPAGPDLLVPMVRYISSCEPMVMVPFIFWIRQISSGRSSILRTNVAYCLFSFAWLMLVFAYNRFSKMLPLRSNC